MNYGWTWSMVEYKLWVIMNNGYIWIVGEYDLCVNINHGLIWIRGEYELGVNMNCGWTLGWTRVLLGGGGQTQGDMHTDIRTHQ